MNGSIEMDLDTGFEPEEIRVSKRELKKGRIKK